VSEYTTAGMQPQPDVSTIQQYPESQYHQPMSPVCLVGENSITTLPARRGRFANFVLSIGLTTEPVVDADPRIRRFYLSASATGVYVGTKEELAASAQSAIVNGGQLQVGWTPGFEGVHEPIYAYSAAGGQTLTVRVEYWAD
jgi:hypothetical protein